MKRNFLLSAGACLVCLAIGYVAGGSRASKDAVAPQTSEETNARGPRTSSRERDARTIANDEVLAPLLKGRSPRDLSGEDVGKLIVQLSKPDSGLSPVAWAKQNYQLQLLLERLSASQLEDAIVTMMDDGEGRRSMGLNSVLNAFTAKDALRALEWAQTMESRPWMVGSVIGAMAKVDPLQAADLFRDRLMDGTFGQMDSWQAASGVAAAMAKLGKSSLLQYIDSLPQQQQGQLLMNSLRELPEGERMGMLDEIHKRSEEGRMEEWAFSNSFSQMAYQDPEMAQTWLEKMEAGEKRAKLELSLGQYYSQTGDVEAMKEWMARAYASSPGKEKELFLNSLNSSGRSPNQIKIMASVLPAGVQLKAEDFQNVTQNMRYYGGSGLSEIAWTLRDPAEKAKLVTTALDGLAKQIRSYPRIGSRLNENDFQIIERQIQKIGLTGDYAEQVRQSLEAARTAKPEAKSKEATEE